MQENYRTIVPKTNQNISKRGAIGTALSLMFRSEGVMGDSCPPKNIM